ncbi:MAG: 3'-5' exonuclease [Pirellulales bacterium]|nr:3'-5' exonuclease [Pirellulales bacterium]
MTTDRPISRYVSIHIRTTGLNPEHCQILEIGAIIDDCLTLVEDCPVFHCYLDHALILGEPSAVAMHQSIIGRIAAHEEGYAYIPSWEAAYRFRDFLKQHGFDPKKEPIVVAGKNYATFDARFLSRLTGCNEHIKVHRRIIDPALLYWQPEIDGMELPDTKTCMERDGISDEVAHTAVTDARVVVRLIRHAIINRRIFLPQNTVAIS